AERVVAGVAGAVRRRVVAAARTGLRGRSQGGGGPRRTDRLAAGGPARGRGGGTAGRGVRDRGRTARLPAAGPRARRVAVGRTARAGPPAGAAVRRARLARRATVPRRPPEARRTRRGGQVPPPAVGCRCRAGLRARAGGRPC